VPEAAVAFGVLGVLVMLAYLTPAALLWLGVGITVGGLAVSTVTGLVYHLRLRAAIGRVGPRPRLWWWAPSRFHAWLGERDRASVMAWFRVGATSFAFCGFGLFVVAGAIVKAILFSR
jgi:hypothetical protein